jgi:putative acetyltransferase
MVSNARQDGSARLPLEVRRDDLSGEATRALLRLHLAGMHANSPPGSGPAFEPALAFYRRRGFVEGAAFAQYRRSEFNQFLHLEL